MLSVLCAAVSLTSERGGLLSNCIVISVMKIDGTLIELANHHQQPGWHSQQPAWQHTPHILTTSHTQCSCQTFFWQKVSQCFWAVAWTVLQLHFDAQQYIEATLIYLSKQTYICLASLREIK